MANLQGFFQVQTPLALCFVKNVCQEFNASKFVLFTALLLFSMLYSLKLDGVLDWSW